jgi:predicted transcriptional regulator of viral defense system
MTASKTTQNVRQGLSKNESLLLSSLSGDGKKIFTLRDIRKELGCSYAYAKDIAKRLARKKWTVGLRRGTYLIVPLSAGANPRYTEHEFVIGAHLVFPYYIAYWSALNFYNLTEQTPFTVFIATTKRAKSRTILDVEYKFVTLNEKKFFGFSGAAIGSDRINISDREKTIADALDHPEYCGGIAEVAKCLWNAKDSVSIEKVAEYGLKMDNATIIKRLGFLVESLDLESKKKEKMAEKFMTNISPGMSALDPTMPRKGRYNTRWNLLVNVSKESLASWREEYQ